MAGSLRASYDAPLGLDKGKERLFVANFDVSERKDIKFNKVGEHIVINGNDGIAIIPGKIEEGFRRYILSAYKEDNEVHVKVESEDPFMRDEDYIKWIAIETESGSYQRKELKPDDQPECVFKSCEAVIAAYAFCNLHGLWKSENVAHIEHWTI